MAGHCHWRVPLAVLDTGIPALNVDSRGGFVGQGSRGKPDRKLQVNFGDREARVGAWLGFWQLFLEALTVPWPGCAAGARRPRGGRCVHEELD